MSRPGLVRWLVRQHLEVVVAGPGVRVEGGDDDLLVPQTAAVQLLAGQLGAPADVGTLHPTLTGQPVGVPGGHHRRELGLYAASSRAIFSAVQTFERSSKVMQSITRSIR